MKCPYCNKNMKNGVIQSPHEIAWLPKKAKLFARSDFHPGSIVLSEVSFFRGSHVVAYCCDDCKKIIIDYNEIDSEN